MKGGLLIGRKPNNDKRIISDDRRFLDETLEERFVVVEATKSHFCAICYVHSPFFLFFFSLEIPFIVLPQFSISFVFGVSICSLWSHVFHLFLWQCTIFLGAESCTKNNPSWEERRRGLVPQTSIVLTSCSVAVNKLVPSILTLIWWCPMNLVYVNVNVWIVVHNLRYLLSLALCIDYRLSSKSFGCYLTLWLSFPTASRMQRKLKTQILYIC